MNYRYAQAHLTGDRWFVAYYFLNPYTNEICRKRIYINRVRDPKLRERIARKLCETINNRLDAGWNPFIREDQKNLIEPLPAAHGLYVQIQECIPPSPLPSKLPLIEWTEKKFRKGFLANDVTDKMANDFMREQLLIKGIKARTYNSKLIDYRGFFSFLVKHRHCQHNPFKAVDRIKQQYKKRMPLSTEMQIQYAKWTRENDYPMYMASMLCYYCGIRPAEIVALKVRDGSS